MSRSRTARLWKPIAVAAGSALCLALLGALMTDLGPWYSDLNQPGWKPPDAVFGPIWTAIFGLAAAAGVIGWRHAPSRIERDRMLVLFALNSFLNVFWSLLYFRLHRPDWALIEVAFLWLSVLVLMLRVARFSKLAAGLLLPYLLWVTIAGVLNWETVKLNGPFGPG
jgi:benzodiazapine receptor